MVSHQSAAELYGLGRLRPRFVHLTSARPAPSGLGQVAVRRGHFTSDEIALAGTFGVTTPVRTILDLADTGISQHALDEVVGDALAIGRVEQVHLATAAAEQPAPIAARVAAALAARPDLTRTTQNHASRISSVVRSRRASRSNCGPVFGSSKRKKYRAACRLPS